MIEKKGFFSYSQESRQITSESVIQKIKRIHPPIQILKKNKLLLWCFCMKHKNITTTYFRFLFDELIHISNRWNSLLCLQFYAKCKNSTTTNNASHSANGCHSESHPDSFPLILNCQLMEENYRWISRVEFKTLNRFVRHPNILTIIHKDGSSIVQQYLLCIDEHLFCFLNIR